MPKAPPSTPAPALPDRGEILIHGTKRLSEERLGVELGVLILDARGNPVPGVQFRVHTATEEILVGQTDARGEARGRRITLIRQGTQEMIFLVVEGSGVSDWKTVPPEREKTAAELEKERRRIFEENEGRIKRIQSGEGGVIRKGEIVHLSARIKVRREITIEEGGELIVEAGTRLEFDEGVGITGYGRLSCLGTKKDSIFFTASEREKTWRNIMLIGSGTKGSVIKGCIVEKGEAIKGGGIYIEGSEVEIREALIRQCLATGNGGGIYAEDSSLKMTEVDMENNRCAENGGGLCIYNYRKNVEIRKSKIINNCAAEAGGGIYTFFPRPSDGNTTLGIESSSIEDNKAKHGGGLSGWIDRLTINRSIVKGNQGQAHIQQRGHYSHPLMAVMRNGVMVFARHIGVIDSRIEDESMTPSPHDSAQLSLVNSTWKQLIPFECNSDGSPKQI